MTKLLVADARIISGIIRLYLLHCGRLAAASRFNDRKTRKRSIRHISDVYTRWPLSMKHAILSFLKTWLCRIPTVYFVSRNNGFCQVDVCLSMPVESCILIWTCPKSWDINHISHSYLFSINIFLRREWLFIQEAAIICLEIEMFYNILVNFGILLICNIPNI